MTGRIEIKENDRLMFQPGQRRGSLAERFGSGAKKKDDKVQEIDEAENIEIARVYELRSFEHPFFKTVDKDIESLADSIKEIGLQNPIIVRENEDGYEILAGHRRTRACRSIGLEYIKAVVKRGISDEEARLIVTDTNLEQREEILPSEKASAYKMRLEALKRQAGRPSKNNFTQVEQNYNSNEEVAREVGESRAQVQRYIRLNELVPELLNMTDEKEISFGAAVNISYLNEAEQDRLLAFIKENQIKISLESSEKLKSESKTAELTYEKLSEILLGKKTQSSAVKASPQKLAKEAANMAIKEVFKNKELKNSMKNMEIEELKEIMLSAIKTYIENKNI